MWSAHRGNSLRSVFTLNNAHQSFSDSDYPKRNAVLKKKNQGQSGFYIPLSISVSSTKVNRNGFVQNIYTTEMNTYNADKCTCALICRIEEVQFSICTKLCVHCLAGP